MKLKKLVLICILFIFAVAAAVIIVIATRKKEPRYSEQEKQQRMEQFQKDVASGALAPMEDGVPREIVTKDGNTFMVILSEAE